MTPKPAILGGDPAFPQQLHLLRPTLPPLAALQPGLSEAFATGILTKGPALRAYEERLADHLGVRSAVGVASCTLGLTLVFDGLAPGEAVMPSFTFMATAMAALRAGLTPVFADIDPLTWCLDPGSAARAVTPRTTVIVPVHLFGNPADEDAFAELSRRTGVPLVYDAAHGFGALRHRLPVGRSGFAQVFSTSPTKLLITGEGGVVATQDDALAEHLRVAREYGNRGDYDAEFAGLNARLSEPAALLGIAGLDLLEAEALRRNRLAAIYRRLLGELPGVSFQLIGYDDRSSYKDFSIRVGPAFGLSRDVLATALAAEGVQTRAYYVPPLHRLRLFAGRAADAAAALPATEALAADVLTLPLYGRMTDADVERVASCAAAVQACAPAVRAAVAAATGDGRDHSVA
jgi:dTDP-4-amino-4,6-dideoxygalactose transaminase